MSLRPRVIFDCNVLLQGMLNPDGASGACMRLVEAGRVCPLLSMETLDEAREVLNRPLVRELAPEMAESDVAQLLARLLYRAEFVGNVRHIQSLPRDPKDEPYLNLALAGAAEYLVTRDNDLLELNEDHSTEGKQFRQRHQNRLKILTPGEFLGVMKQAEQ